MVTWASEQENYWIQRN